MERLRLPDTVLELCCFEWFQNAASAEYQKRGSFRAVLFRMVPKRAVSTDLPEPGFRAVLFRMVPKRPLRPRKGS